jgi:hypothetical protein
LKALDCTRLAVPVAFLATAVIDHGNLVPFGAEGMRTRIASPELEQQGPVLAGWYT